MTKFAKETKADPLVFCLFRDAGAFPVMMCAAFLVEGKLSFPSLRLEKLLFIANQAVEVSRILNYVPKT